MSKVAFSSDGYRILFHENLGDALRQAYAICPCVVAYRQGYGWHVYPASDGDKYIASKPDFFVVRTGMLPIPLHDLASEGLISLILDKANSAAKRRTF